jgi:hypothetical protein
VADLRCAGPAPELAALDRARRADPHRRVVRAGRRGALNGRAALVVAAVLLAAAGCVPPPPFVPPGLEPTPAPTAATGVRVVLTREPTFRTGVGTPVPRRDPPPPRETVAAVPPAGRARG